mmetsp:Transcript_21633/g.15885  ORF Transcript_21633/g.15885 Transcript_21633/m.15885 type:complete len:119 (+) Transcript_21633:58-414(+)
MLRVDLKFRGLGVSVIDKSPKELLFFSVHDLEVNLGTWWEARGDGAGVVETLASLRLNVGHLQLDNMNEVGLPVILAPQKPLFKNESKEEGKRKEGKRNAAQVSVEKSQAASKEFVGS